MGERSFHCRFEASNIGRDSPPNTGGSLYSDAAGRRYRRVRLGIIRVGMGPESNWSNPNPYKSREPISVYTHQLLCNPTQCPALAQRNNSISLSLLTIPTRFLFPPHRLWTLHQTLAHILKGSTLYHFIQPLLSSPTT